MSVILRPLNLLQMKECILWCFDVLDFAGDKFLNLKIKEFYSKYPWSIVPLPQKPGI